MESVNERDVDHSWNSETSWTVAGGCLTSSVTFELSSIPISDDDNDQATIDSTSHSGPLILCPPSPDPNPCDITIIFANKHEVRQVYVRSTARVYEIYYTPEVGSSSEYLCTVRCGIAARDDQVLQTTDSEGTVGVNVKGDCKEADDKKMKIDSNLHSNEDDWVEVKIPSASMKIPSASMIDNGSNFLQSNIVTNPGEISQDYYEATAQITDANPCISVTVRLLSLQNKGFICVDEVYVFADPANPVDLENQAGSLDNSAGSSLMALLVPTFLQLSKSTGVGRQEKRDTFDTRERQIPEGLKAINATNDMNKVSQKETPDVFDHQTMKCPQVSDAESESVVPDRCTEVLEHLVSRVSRVEDLLLRFEENMLKPINTIEVRLERVEQQLELLSKKTQNSGVQSCTRFAAPDFSCCTSYCNSFYNDGSDNLKTYELSRKDLASNVLPGFPDGDHACSVNTAKLQPSLVVTAPDFSSGDYDEENDAVDLVMGSPKIKRKHVISIDDALAAALDGLSSLTSMHPQKYLQTSAIKAAEFLNEEGKNDVTAALPRVHSEIRTDNLIDGTECAKTSVSSICNTLSLEAEENWKSTHSGDNFEKIHGAVNRQCHRSDREEGAFHGTAVDYTAALPLQNENCDAKDIMKSGEVSHSDDNSQKTHAEVDGQCHLNDKKCVPFQATTVDYTVASSTRNDTCDVEDGVKTGVVGHGISSHGNDSLENGDRGVDVLCQHNHRVPHFHASHVDSTVTFMPSNEPCDMKDGTKTGEVGHETGSHGDDYSEKTHGGFDGQYHCNDEEVVHYHATTIDKEVSSMRMNEMCDVKDGIETGEIDHNKNVVLKADSLGQLTGNQIDTDSDITQDQEAAVVRPAVADTHKVAEEESNKDVLQDILAFPHPTSSLDFELPILDVRFISDEHGKNKSSLEALLGESRSLEVESPSIVETSDGCKIDDKGEDLISLDDVDQSSPIAGGKLAVDMDYCTLTDMHVKVEDEERQDHNGCLNLETYTASLI